MYVSAPASCPPMWPLSTGSLDGFLFSVRLQLEGLRELEGGFVERQVVDSGPEIQNVTVGAAVGMKPLENVLAEVGGERALGVGRLTVDWAEAAALLATPAQTAEQSQVFEDLLHGHLLTQEGEVDLDVLAFRWRRWVDRSRWRR
jgi:hypothetical protein